jgi:hypothetical protein
MRISVMAVGLALALAGLGLILALPQVGRADPAAAMAAIIYVDTEATGGDDGSSWADAYTNLQDALDDATYGDEIWVAEGVYTPTAGVTRTATFQLVGGVALHGGFDPSVGDDAFAERDWQNHVTVLSGDLDGDDATDAHGVVTTTAHIAGDNAWTVVTGSGVTETAVLDGFVVTGGQANGSTCSGYGPCNSGGGMYDRGGSPTVRNVTFSSNSADLGGGMFNYDNSDPTLTDVTFSSNSAEYGGGMFNEWSSDSTLTNVTFSSNSAVWWGGGMYNEFSDPTLTNVTFSGNAASSGGGMANNGSDPRLTNVTFSGNAASSGGGMYNYQGSDPRLTNVTFSANSAEWGGGMYNGGSIPTLTNCILWGNTASNAGAQIYNTSSSTPTISYSDVQDGCPLYSNCSDLLDADPLFVRDPDPGDGDWTTLEDNDYGDLRLLPSSPAVDAGDNTAVPADTTDLDGDGDTTEPVPLDLAGNSRFLDTSGKTDTGNGTAPIVDMGAYEGSVLYVDADAAGAGTGVSWTDAFTQVQSALDTASSGYDIWVAEGVYVPTAGVTRTVTFQLVGGVALYGGFDPLVGDDAFAERDWGNHVTVLSGDLDGDDATDAHGVVTTTAHIAGDNAWTVVTGSGVTETAVLDGFVVTGGQANGSSGDCDLHEPCRTGGGMYNQGGSPTVRNVTFSGNSASSGGGMANFDISDPTLTNVTFSANSAGYSGGGMYNDDSDPTLTNVTFSANSAGYSGGGMYNDVGAPTLTNVTFSANSAARYCGGMCNGGSSPTLTNVTFSGNRAGLGGGMHNDVSNPTLTNCILWGNTAISGTQIYNHDSDSTPTITYSDVQGGCPLYSNCSDLLDADPQFVRDPDPGDGDWTTLDDNDYGDLRLRPGSPAIDAGDNSAVPPGITTDLGGNPRFFDVPTVPDTGSGGAPIVDMGAYERQSGSAPSALGDAYATPEDTPLAVAAPGVLANDSDAESDPLAVALDSGPSHGTLTTLNEDGSFSYDPDPDYNGVDTFTYAVSDTIFTSTATVSITVTPINDPPTISDIPDQAGKQNTAIGPTPFTVGDVDDPPAGLALLAETSDAAILPVGNVAFGGAGADRTLTVTPLLEGTVVVTVTVGDGSATALDTFALTVEKHTVYLPLVCNNYVVAPDLVVERIVATVDDVQVVIANRGNAPASDDFWVDVYLDPDPAPTHVNQIWPDLSAQGLVWGVTANLATGQALIPGEVLTLTVGGDYYVAAYSHVAWPLPVGTQVYAQVDSANVETTYGGVLESHEITGGAYNNVAGPFPSTAGDGARMPVEPSRWLGWPIDLPRRTQE